MISPCGQWLLPARTLQPSRVWPGRVSVRGGGGLGAALRHGERWSLWGGGGGCVTFIPWALGEPRLCGSGRVGARSTAGEPGQKILSGCF